MELSISYKNILKVAFPIIISGIAQNVVNVTDTMFLGQVSEVALGASGNAGIFYFILIISGMGLSTGSQIIIGRRNGEKNYKLIGRVFDHTLYFMVPMAILLYFFIIYVAPGLLETITKSSNIYAASIDYLNYRAPGIFFAFINFIFIAFYVGTTNTKVLTYTTVVMSITNVFLDYGLIFGNWGLPEMGVKGAALASTISEITAFTFFLVYTLIAIDLKKYALFRFKETDKDVFRRIFKVGSPIMLQNFLSLSSWFIFFMIIEKLGEQELAVSHIIRSIYMVLMIPLFGFSSATNTLVSNLIGQGRADEVLTLIKRVTIMSLASTFLVLQMNILFPEEMIRFYSKNPEVIAQTLSTLNVISFTMFFFSVAYIVFNGVTGTGNTRASLIIETITISIYLILAYVIAIELNADLPLVWCSEFVYFTLLGFLSYFYLKKRDWRNVSI